MDLIFRLRHLLFIVLAFVFVQCQSPGVDDFNKGITALGKNNKKEAIEFFTKAILKDSTKYEYYFFRGRAKYDTSDFKGAIIDFNKTLKLEKDYISAIFFKGLSHYNLDEYDLCIEVLSKAISLEPNDTVAFLFRGMSFYKTKKFIDAIEDLTIYISLCPKDYEGYEYRAKSKMELNSIESALNDISLANKLNPDGADYDIFWDYSSQYLDSGLSLFRSEYYEDAIPCFDKVVVLDTANGLAFYYRGLCYYYIDEDNLALSDFSECIRLEKSFPKSYAYRANIKFDLGDKDGACKDWNTAKALDTVKKNVDFLNSMIKKHCN